MSKDLITATEKGIRYRYREFDSISEFVKYIEETPVNDAFKTAMIASHDTKDPYFYHTKSYEEAMFLLKNGDKKIAEKLTGKLKLEKHPENMMVQKPSYGVAGYQASVPRYLQGMPTSMITKKQVVQKQKVITITKNIGYTAFYSAESIIKEATQAVKLINTIEANGIRCNLYITSIAQAGPEAIGFRIKIKSASERAHISKMAFPLANPSMLRRFAFRYREVAPETPHNFVGSYGTSMQPKFLFETKKGEYFIPTMAKDDEIEKLIARIIK